MIGNPSADLVFDPTLAVRTSALRCPRPHSRLSGISPRTDLHLDRTMLPAALGGLRGPFCLRLASAFNHRPEGLTGDIISDKVLKRKKYLCFRQKNTKNAPCSPFNPAFFQPFSASRPRFRGFFIPPGALQPPAQRLRVPSLLPAPPQAPAAPPPAPPPCSGRSSRPEPPAGLPAPAGYGPAAVPR